MFASTGYREYVLTGAGRVDDKAVSDPTDKMARDKKNRESRIRFALPVSIGAMAPGEGWTVAVVAQAVRSVLHTQAESGA